MISLDITTTTKQNDSCTGDNFAQRISLHPDNIQQYLPTQTLAFEYLRLLNICEKQTEYLCKRKGECATSGLECGSASTLCHGRSH